MKYLKNIEIAELYKVSPNTVGNWIESAEKKKNSLQLVSEGGRTYILNLAANHTLLKDLSLKGKKYKNSKSLKVIYPQPEFYKIFNEEQIIDIITDLEVNNEIDIKYTYFDIGAKSWDDKVNRSVNDEKIKVTVNSTLKLIKLTKDFLDDISNKYKNINIVDLGAGNGVPAKPLIEHFLAKKVLKEYIAIDYSPDLLKIVEANIKSWFGNDLKSKYYQRDFNFNSLRKLLFENAASEDTINILLFLGTTIENQRQYTLPLNNIRNSMGQNDVLIIGHRLDSQSARQEINFNINNKQLRNVDLDQLSLILKLLNISEEYYNIERYYVKRHKSRIIATKLKYDLRIEIKTDNFTKILYLSNKTKIIIFRHNHHSFREVIDILDNNGFDPINAIEDLEYEQIFAFAKLKKNNRT